MTNDALENLVAIGSLKSYSLTRETTKKHVDSRHLHTTIIDVLTLAFPDGNELSLATETIHHVDGNVVDVNRNWLASLKTRDVEEYKSYCDAINKCPVGVVW